MKAFWVAFTATLGYELAGLLIGLIRLTILIAIGLAIAYHFGAFKTL